MNTTSSTHIILAAITIVLSMLACNFGQPPAEEIPTSDNVNPTPTEESESNEQGPCSNALYPVMVGATWTFTGSDGLDGSYTYTDTITEVREEGFTLVSQFDGLTRTQEWACEPEGLTSLTFGGGPAAGISTSGVQLDLTTSNIQGVNLPKVVNVGDQWIHSLDFEGTMEISGSSADVMGTATYAFTAAGEERIIVPAGTFDATKIHVDLTVDMQITFSGVGTPAEFTSSSDVWFVPGVGWVKTTGAGVILGTAYNENIELQSYSIP